MWPVVVAAFALFLIFEGALPLAAPARWKAAFHRILELSNGQIRFLGFVSIAIGVILLFVISLI